MNVFRTATWWMSPTPRKPLHNFTVKKDQKYIQSYMATAPVLSLSLHDLCILSTVNLSMKKTPMATALRTRCAERTRAMQLVCMCASSACTVLFTERSCLKRHEVQV